MPRIEFTLQGTEYIELIRLLKFVGIAENGGQAQEMVTRGIVSHNGVIELRKRAKLRAGDVVCVGQNEICIKA